MARSAEEQVGVQLPDYDSAQPPAAEPPAAAAPPEAPGDRPDWLPDNFTDGPSLVKSYNEMGGKLREVGERARQMEERLAHLEQAPTPTEPAQDPQQFDAWQEQLESVYEANPLQAMAWLAQNAAEAAAARQLGEYQQQQYALQQPQQNAQAQLIAHQADQMLAAKYADWSTVKEHVGAAFEADPGLMTAEESMSPEGAARAFERAYKQVKYAEVEQALAAGQQVSAYDPQAGGMVAGAPHAPYAPPANPQFHQQQQLLSQNDLARVVKMQQQTLTGGSGRPEANDAGEQWSANMKQALQGSSWAAHRGTS